MPCHRCPRRRHRRVLPESATTMMTTTRPIRTTTTTRTPTTTIAASRRDGRTNPPAPGAAAARRVAGVPPPPGRPERPSAAGLVVCPSLAWGRHGSRPRRPALVLAVLAVEAGGRPCRPLEVGWQARSRRPWPISIATTTATSQSQPLQSLLFLVSTNVDMCKKWRGPLLLSIIAFAPPHLISHSFLFSSFFQLIDLFIY